MGVATASTATGEEPGWAVRLVLWTGARLIDLALAAAALVVALSSLRPVFERPDVGSVLGVRLEPVLAAYESGRAAALGAVGLGWLDPLGANGLALSVLTFLALHVASARRHGQFFLWELLRNFAFLPLRALGLRLATPPSLFSLKGPSTALPSVAVSLALAAGAAHLTIYLAQGDAGEPLRLISRAAGIALIVGAAFLLAGFLSGFVHRPADELDDLLEAARLKRLRPPMTAFEYGAGVVRLGLYRLVSFLLILPALPGFLAFLLGSAMVNGARVFTLAFFVFLVALALGYTVWR